MPTTDEMSVSDRRTYLKQMKKRYVTAKRVERGGLLTEMEQVTGLHRKSLTRLMHASSLERKPRVRQRTRTMGQQSSRYMCFIIEEETGGKFSKRASYATGNPCGICGRLS